MFGIYGIHNLISGKWYVGSTDRTGITNRWKQHRRLLAQKHHSRRLQLAWNKYGSSVWEWVVLEFLPQGDPRLLERENWWISHHDAYQHGYNGRPKAENNSGYHFKHTEIAKQRMSDAKKGKFTKEQAAALKLAWVASKTPTALKKLSASLSDRTLSLKHRQNIGIANSRRRLSVETKALLAKKALAAWERRRLQATGSVQQTTFL